MLDEHLGAEERCEPRVRVERSLEEVRRDAGGGTAHVGKGRDGHRAHARGHVRRLTREARRLRALPRRDRYLTVSVPFMPPAA